MTRLEPHPNLAVFDPEIERTLRLIRTARRRLFDTSFVKDTSIDNSDSNSLVSISSPNSADNPIFQENMANPHNKTLKELAALNVNY